jgi:hypothetical protein
VAADRRRGRPLEAGSGRAGAEEGSCAFMVFAAVRRESARQTSVVPVAVVTEAASRRPAKTTLHRRVRGAREGVLAEARERTAARIRATA